MPTCLPVPPPTQCVWARRPWWDRAAPPAGAQSPRRGQRPFRSPCRPRHCEYAPTQMFRFPERWPGCFPVQTGATPTVLGTSVLRRGRRTSPPVPAYCRGNWGDQLGAVARALDRVACDACPANATAPPPACPECPKTWDVALERGDSTPWHQCAARFAVRTCPQTLPAAPPSVARECARPRVLRFHPAAFPSGTQTLGHQHQRHRHRATHQVGMGY